MSIQEIAVAMVNLLRRKKFIEAQTEFYHQNVFSMEPDGHQAPKTVGKKQLLEKERKFLKVVKEWHAYEVSEPLVSSNHFSLRMYSYITLIDGNSIELDEIIVYEVVDHKIVSEHYFYTIN